MTPRGGQLDGAALKGWLVVMGYVTAITIAIVGGVWLVLWFFELGGGYGR